MPADSIIGRLIKNGVKFIQPETVFVDPEIPPDHIAPGTVIFPGCRIIGRQTAIGPDCQLGAEAPATIDNCQLGSKVELRGGFFQQAVFFDGAQMGSGAHVRPGTILEEEASGAHTVGLKQTVLFPFVTLGSLINFCDCLMAGGTSRKNHSEVGSSYVHFNFTPHQDKATPSLIGDVPNGVFLDQPPIFLGGQGGLVGPASIAYGVVVPAGAIVRGNITSGGLHPPPAPPPDRQKSHAYQPGRYHSIQRILANNFAYIGNILALDAWYDGIRTLFSKTSTYCLRGARACLDIIRQERLKRLDELAEKMPRSLELHGVTPHTILPDQSFLLLQRRFHENWPAARAQLEKMFSAPPTLSPTLIAEASVNSGENYITAIKKLPPETKEKLRHALAGIVQQTCAVMHQHIVASPS